MADTEVVKKVKNWRDSILRKALILDVDEGTQSTKMSKGNYENGENTDTKMDKAIDEDSDVELDHNLEAPSEDEKDGNVSVSQQNGDISITT